MKRWLGPLLTMLVAAVGTHALVVHEAPRFIMGKAMQRMEQRGIPLNRFVLAARMTPQTQTVVRPSPDLAYSICRFDFNRQHGPIKIVMAPYKGYSSLSLFDASTDNFLTVRGDGKQRQVALVAPGTNAKGGVIASPSRKGLILIRRLAPDQQSYDRVKQVAQNDICQGAAD